ncbi:peptidase [Dactylosporangium vinaceum]|uniref:Clp protease N-terminal domain-containing protein n=1 Tax=Dactylosporangium vinaceum TaxID=53362 RepID=A0ABV5MSI1_9ACTN|nr:Clp protease N-terminal domain-containing protein [Dactylosporangium vinaceum]UAC00643.1 peptidase [Dactylosporangium vinaceum]
MFERFDELAKRAVVAAQDAALSMGHDGIGTGHLLLGLTQTAGPAGEALRAHGVELRQARTTTAQALEEAGVEATGGRPARDALASIGIDVAEIQRRADDNFGQGAFQFPRPRFSRRALNALELALHEADGLGRRDIDTGHLLLGLLDQSDSVAMRVLDTLGVDREPLRATVLQVS